jgi:hypothetical protein
MFAAPIRVIKVSRPGSLSGLSRSHNARTSSGVAVGPSLQPTGFLTPERKWTCAPSIARVRSPTHNKCAEQS